MMKKIRILSLILALVSGVSYLPAAQAGLQLDTTRIIYPEGEKSVSVNVGNVGGKSAYLVQSAVSSDPEGKVNAPFISTPPLLRIESGGENQIRIMKTGESLPKDRESLFWFSVKGIPAANGPLNIGDTDGIKNLNAGIYIGVGVFVKLIYRPQGLSISQQAGFSALQVRHIPGGVRLSNSSPYYLNFSSLDIGGKTVISPEMNVKAATLAPFSTMDIAVKGLSMPAKAIWKLLTDQGAVVKFQGDVL